MQAAALRPAQLEGLREALPADVGALNLAAAAWLSRFDALMAPHRCGFGPPRPPAAACEHGVVPSEACRCARGEGFHFVQHLLRVKRHAVWLQSCPFIMRHAVTCAPHR